MNENLKYWNSFNQPPRTALKQIEAGRMRGKTDINPQWRYKAMTETFGPVGIGWKYTIDKMWTEAGSNDETFVFVNVSVYVKVDGVWSEPIPGNGGSTLVVKEKNSMYNDDDAFKKATTDALSTAMKMLGVAADIYAGAWDGGKYRAELTDNSQSSNGKVSQSASTQKVSNEIITVAEWEAFQQLVTSAKEKGVKLPEYDRAKMTPDKLTGYKNYITQEIGKVQ